MFEKIKDFFKRDETKPGEDSQVSNISEIKEEKKSNDKNFKEVISSVFNKRNRKRWAVGDGERRKRRQQSGDSYERDRYGFCSF